MLSVELFDRIKNDDALVDEVRPEPSVSPTTIDKFATGSAGDNPCKQGKG